MCNMHRHGVGLMYRYNLRDWDSYFDRDLYGIRDNFLNRVRHFLLYRDGVRFWYRYWVMLNNRHRDGNVDGVRNSLFYRDRVGVRDWNCHFFGDDNALDAAGGLQAVGTIPQ